MTRYLLDTNVVFWLLVDRMERVPTPVQELLEAEVNDVNVSAVNPWEIAIKRSLGRLELPNRWPRRIAELGFGAIPVTTAHAEATEHLPWHHKDPFDRLLVAQAMVEGMTLVSADSRLAAYEVEVLW